MTFNSPFSQKTLNILKASLPFIPSGMQRMVSNLVKIEEFNIMVQNLNDSLDSTIRACEYSAGNNGSNPFNSGDLISAIKPYLDDKERELIDMLLNMMNAIKIYNIFQSFPSAAPSDSQNADNPDFENHEFENHGRDTEVPNDNVLSDDKVQDDDYQNYEAPDYVEADINESDSEPENSSNMTNQNGFNIESLKNLLSPSQRAMFETYSTLLNNNSNIN